MVKQHPGRKNHRHSIHKINLSRQVAQSFGACSTGCKWRIMVLMTASCAWPGPLPERKERKGMVAATYLISVYTSKKQRPDSILLQIQIQGRLVSPQSTHPENADMSNQNNNVCKSDFFFTYSCGSKRRYLWLYLSHILLVVVRKAQSWMHRALTVSQNFRATLNRIRLGRSFEMNV